MKELVGSYKVGRLEFSSSPVLQDVFIPTGKMRSGAEKMSKVAARRPPLHRADTLRIFALLPLEIWRRGTKEGRKEMARRPRASDAAWRGAAKRAAYVAADA